jgi:hypothetical protein
MKLHSVPVQEITKFIVMLLDNRTEIAVQALTCLNL